MADRDNPIECPDCPGTLMEREISHLQDKQTSKSTAKTRVDSFLKKAKEDLSNEKKDLSRRTK